MQISAGNSHSIFLDQEGGVWTFGFAENGQLGHGDENDKFIPTKIQHLPPIMHVSAGMNHSGLISYP